MDPGVCAHTLSDRACTCAPSRIVHVRARLCCLVNPSTRKHNTHTHHTHPKEECLLFADRVSGQFKADSAFSKACKQHARSHVVFGPACATHLWQPLDHHIGARYKHLMGKYYDDWMMETFDTQDHWSTADRRTLMTTWAGRAWRELEEQRIERELACVNDATAERSMFYRAFLHTGCLVTADGTDDHLITIGKAVKGDLLDALRAGIMTPEQLAPQVMIDEEFIITLSSTDEEESGYASTSSSDNALDGVPLRELLSLQAQRRTAPRPHIDTEDEDDDTTEHDDDGEEPPGDIELDVPDEAALMARACASIPVGDDQQQSDFSFARRVARQHAPAHLVEEFKTVEPPAQEPGDPLRRSTRRKRVRGNSLMC
jgi:hypothetical protein